MSEQAAGSYFLPPPSHWPVLGCFGLFITFIGAAHWLHNVPVGPYVLALGIGVIALMLIGWFGNVIRENQAGRYNSWVGQSFRSGMAWMIFSEVVFFAGFFAGLFFIRLWSVPELGGDIDPITNLILWPEFEAHWPLLSNPDNHKYLGAHAVSDPWRIPALNTLLLLSSGVTITWAHWGLMRDKRRVLAIGLILTIALGVSFLMLQGSEYYDAYTKDGLTLNAGVYGSTFFLLTGFHGVHVLVGTMMLVVILGRSLAGHFSPAKHFGFQGVAWYWHFVDVVWLLLFVFVYWL
ncbi:MAG: cytochrome c oxidase subunit 3 [Gammaproteobacteria bacterium]